MFRVLISIIFCLFILCKPSLSWAGEFIEDQGGSSTEGTGDSTIDPFSDYSEFEEGSEEEADLNFFHNGRFFSIGILGGYESFTDTLGIIYSPSVQFGLFLEYFFDLKLAMQLAYVTANHGLTIATGNSAPWSGNVQISRFEFDFKYYLNTQNVTRGLAALNPYLLIGGASYTRKTNITGSGGEVDDSAFGAQAGGGIEIPMMHNTSFFGIQATYDYIGWANANQPIMVNGQSQGLTPNGNAVSLMGILGMSF